MACICTKAPDTHLLEWSYIIEHTRVWRQHHLSAFISCQHHSSHRPVSWWIILSGAESEEKLPPAGQVIIFVIVEDREIVVNLSSSCELWKVKLKNIISSNAMIYLNLSFIYIYIRNVNMIKRQTLLNVCVGHAPNTWKCSHVILTGKGMIR